MQEEDVSSVRLTVWLLHNCYTSGEGILKGIEKKEYSMELDNDYTGHFKFAADGETVTYSEGTATHIVPHQYSNHPYFDYDETTQKYLRSEYPDRSARCCTDR